MQIPFRVIFLYTSLMSPNPQTTFTPLPNPSKEGTPEWFYDEIMRFIEPDLLTTVIPLHAEKYAKQSKEECLARLQAYDRAFEIFDKASQDVAKEYRAGMEKVREEAKEDVQKGETKALQQIEQSIEEEGKH